MFDVLSRQMFRRTALALGLVLALGGMTTGVTQSYADEADQDRARAAMLRGEVEPLPKALSVLEKHFTGDVIEVELEEEEFADRGPTLIYEMKILSPQGRVIKVKLHAKTLEMLSAVGNDEEGYIDMGHVYENKSDN